MDNLIMQRSLQVINGDKHLYIPHWINTHQFGHLLLVETIGKEREAITELMVQLALRGSFNLIAGDEWLPDRDTLYRSVRRYTLQVDETLDRPNIKRPMTCLQMLDLLMEADMQNRPTWIFNFLHHFYNADVELSLRNRILRRSCQYAKRLSLCNPVTILVPRLITEEHKRFFAILADIADEVIPLTDWFTIETSQGSLF